LKNSLTTANECRIFRENLQQLNKLIGTGYGKELSNEILEGTDEPQDISSDQLEGQPDEKIPPDLREFFGVAKRKDDLKLL